MNKPNENVLISAINAIYKESENQELSAKNLKQLRPHLRVISSYLGTSHLQSLFFSLIIVESFSGCTVNMKELAKHLQVNPTQLLQYLDDFTKLETKGILSAKPNRSAHSSILSNKEYIIQSEVVNAILLQQPCPKLQKVKVTSLVDALGQLYQLIDQLDEHEISHMQYNLDFKLALSQFEKMPFFGNLKNLELNTNELSILVYVIWKFLSGSTSVDIERLLGRLVGAPSQKMRFMLDLKSTENKLTKHELLEIVYTRFFNDLELKPSVKTIEFLRENGIPIEAQLSKQNGLIVPSSIGEKMLFYSSTEMHQISSIQSMMEEQNYQTLLSRLRSKNLPLSMNILLYGAPGTGKTETVLQLARQSGREIIKVEISQTKSMWYGESEKLIKRVFTDYAKYAEHCALTPILFFNEADAILGKRNELNSSVNQTQNTIQNILLEELENFNGIFMATTNLANNLDTAFERRFLFKVEFQIPDATIRSQIWQSKLPDLSQEEALKLATQFNLSGGQIENVVRKCEIEFILHGGLPDFDTLLRFCSEEKLSGSSLSVRKSIGF
jgi:hypothetical protein